MQKQCKIAKTMSGDLHFHLWPNLGITESVVVNMGSKKCSSLNRTESCLHWLLLFDSPPGRSPPPRNSEGEKKLPIPPSVSPLLRMTGKMRQISQAGVLYDRMGGGGGKGDLNQHTVIQFRSRRNKNQKPVLTRFRSGLTRTCNLMLTVLL